MKKALLIGIAGGLVLSTWSVATMLWPVSYRTWDIGRSALFVAFVLALTAMAASATRTGASAMRTFGAVAFGAVVAAGITLTTYAIVTRVFVRQIVQLPEYMADYTYHQYTSPAIYVSTNYSDLLGLQVFSWAVCVIGILVVAGGTGRRIGRRRVMSPA